MLKILQQMLQYFVLKSLNFHMEKVQILFLFIFMELGPVLLGPVLIKLKEPPCM